jgi:formylglycine-generating enzyme required for sulfatase activity
LFSLVEKKVQAAGMTSFCLRAWFMILIAVMISGVSSARAQTRSIDDLHGQADSRIIPDLGLELRRIPPGTFIIGSPETETGRREWEGPRQTVTLTYPFWLGATPVTQHQWRLVMGFDLKENLRRTLADDRRHELGAQREMLTYRERVRRRYKTESIEVLCFGAGENIPMIWVDWDQAIEFCRRLTERERRAGRLSAEYEFRLPTEAEREYACRGGTTEATYAGDLVLKDAAHAPVLDGIAWYAANSSDGPHPVALKTPNTWGLYDMLGNVDEWTLDWYAPALPRGVDPTGPLKGDKRVFRGGSWQNPPQQLRAAARYTGMPDFRDADVGFRVALCPVRQVRAD